jgi:hypothetical protein
MANEAMTVLSRESWRTWRDRLSLHDMIQARRKAMGAADRVISWRRDKSL